MTHLESATTPRTLSALGRQPIGAEHWSVRREWQRLEAIERKAAATGSGATNHPAYRIDPQGAIAQNSAAVAESGTDQKYVAAGREEALRRAGHVDAESELGRSIGRSNMSSPSPLLLSVTNFRRSLTAPELEQLRSECETDWQSYSETFRPRQPR